MSIDQEIYTLSHSAVQAANEALAKETERWLQMTLEYGPGWRLWRSEPQIREEAVDTGTGNFHIGYGFRILQPGQEPYGAGTIFTPPDDDTHCPHPPCTHTIGSFRARSACGFGGCPWGGDI